MNPTQARRLGKYLQKARAAKGLSGRALSELTGVDDSSIIRIEHGKVAAPSPEKLMKIAEALDLSTADVFERAGYATPSDLPAMAPYLRTKYDLPPEALEQIERYAKRIAKKHGIAIDGPEPGQDESP